MSVGRIWFFAPMNVMISFWKSIEVYHLVLSFSVTFFFFFFYPFSFLFYFLFYFFPFWFLLASCSPGSANIHPLGFAWIFNDLLRRTLGSLVLDLIVSFPPEIRAHDHECEGPPLAPQIRKLMPINRWRIRFGCRANSVYFLRSAWLRHHAIYTLLTSTLFPWDIALPFFLIHLHPPFFIFFSSFLSFDYHVRFFAAIPYFQSSTPLTLYTDYQRLYIVFILPVAVSFVGAASLKLIYIGWIADLKCLWLANLNIWTNNGHTLFDSHTDAHTLFLRDQPG